MSVKIINIYHLDQPFMNYEGTWNLDGLANGTRKSIFIVTKSVLT